MVHYVEHGFGLTETDRDGVYLLTTTCNLPKSSALETPSEQESSRQNVIFGYTLAFNNKNNLILKFILHLQMWNARRAASGCVELK
jgi:hypothetical protein